MTEGPAITTPNMNWVTLLEHHADRYPDKVFAEFEGDSTTYGQLLVNVRRLSAGMTGLGLGRGDVIGLMLNNSTLFFELFLAASHAGIICMPINTRLTAAEVAYMLENSGARLLFSESDFHDVVTAAVRAVEVDATGVWVDGTSAHGWLGIEELRAEDLHASCVEIGGDEVQRLMYTSGTTSRPKGVMLSHANLMWKCLSHQIEFGFSPTDIGLVCGPMYHVGALDATVTNMLHVGGSVVIHRRYNAEAVAAEVARGRVTNIWMAPSMISLLLALPDLEPFTSSSVRLVIAGGEKMPESRIARLEELFPNAWFADAFGLTEYISADTALARRMTREKLGSVGKACAYVEIAIWDADGNPVEPGVHGEIVTRSRKIFLGYWKNPEATEWAFRGGWFHTDDVGYLDEDGYLYIVDRLKDVIVSGGENIASLEIERVLYEHPDIVEVAAVARPDPRWGEVPHAYVVIKAGAAVTDDDLAEHCYASLARYKVPKSFERLDELPRNLSGKVLKNVLRARLAEAPESTS